MRHGACCPGHLSAREGLDYHAPLLVNLKPRELNNVFVSSEATRRWNLFSEWRPSLSTRWQEAPLATETHFSGAANSDAQEYNWNFHDCNGTNTAWPLYNINVNLLSQGATVIYQKEEEPLGVGFLSKIGGVLALSSALISIAFVTAGRVRAMRRPPLALGSLRFRRKPGFVCARRTRP